MFAEFPKKRPELPEEFKKIYLSHYQKNRGGKTPATFFSKRMESWMHKKVASDVRGQKAPDTLEIGAGTLNHLEFENTGVYDIVEPFTELYFHSPEFSKVRQFYTDISQINPVTKYKRIISIAMFEHVLDVPAIVAKTCALLEKDGTLRVAIPNEGNVLWKLGWKLTTGIEYRLKYGLDYSVLMQHEHINSANEIETILNFFYKNVKCKYFGLSKNFAFYRFYECSGPNEENVRKYFKEKSN
ncbi:MAG: methyltransferase domain-containing protein [Bacteroidia bacterium]